MFLRTNNRKHSNKKQVVVYRSDQTRSNLIAKEYSKTINSSYRYLVYRDMPILIKKYVSGINALDYGCGTGISSKFLINQGFKVTGVDLNEEMLKQAQRYCSLAKFYHVNDSIFLNNSKKYDLILSSFVLTEIGTREDMVSYLQIANQKMQENSIFIGIASSQHMYLRNWLCFNNKYVENQNLKSGNKVKVFAPEVNMEFIDYYWTESDYFNFLKQSNLTLIDTYYPLGNVKDPLIWQDELNYSPFLILIAKKRN